MKAKLFTTLALLLSLASPALAAGTRTDHSGLVVWTFLGFCGLIVVAQLVPALLVMLGAVKGITQGSAQVAEQRAKH
ncbi:hypothetical protein [Geoalkalibacter sp.]|uniref:hypothetical protein n=1 Tax=Geoalkalibacter sp. TaxID=3041440 RepID=UPI00272DEF31|nr:hypothetical protein [Geoalkalibacter sp.]